MSTLAALSRLHAARAGRAERLYQVRHHRLVDQPLVLVVAKTAGEAAAPLACMVGTDRRRPVALTVLQPRDHVQRHGFYSALAEQVMPYIRQREATLQVRPAKGKRPARQLCADAPQIVVANRPTVDFVQLMGRTTRFGSRIENADPAVAQLGRWLTFFVDRAEHPGSSLLLPVTDLLSTCWATGQSHHEDANLATLLAWIDPPAELDGAEAALRAENPVDFPPAGPVTDPAFDLVLDRRLRTYRRALQKDDAITADKIAGEVRAMLVDELKPTWDLIWNGLALLRGIPEAAHCDQRWEDDRSEFTGYSLYLESGGVPQPVDEKATDAARRLSRLEQAQKRFEDEQALDDPFVLAERRHAGVAFAGTVIAIDPDRQVRSPRGRPILRPRFTVRTADPAPQPREQDLIDPHRPDKTVRIRDVLADGPDTFLVTLEVTKGAGRIGKPSLNPVPELGAAVCYTAKPQQWGVPPFPTREQTPWTHGGPPTPETTEDLR